MREITLIVPNAAAEEALADLVDLCPEGVEERDLPASGPGGPPRVGFIFYETEGLAEGDAAGDEPHATIRAGDRQRRLEQLVKRLAERYGDTVALVERVVPNQNWREAWKVHFKLQRIPPFVIRPSWIDYQPAPDEHVIHLDPGSAFGSGLHETTRLCLRSLAVLHRQGARPGWVLDFGCGTGILGLAAIRLFDCQVVAVENDPLARQACRENVERNAVSTQVRIHDSLADVATSAELTVANVSRPVLLEYAESLVDATTAGGWLVLSGLLADDEPVLRDCYEDQGARLESVARDGDWLAMVLKRERASE